MARCPWPPIPGCASDMIAAMYPDLCEVAGIASLHRPPGATSPPALHGGCPCDRWRRERFRCARCGCRKPLCSGKQLIDWSVRACLGCTPSTATPTHFPAARPARIADFGVRTSRNSGTQAVILVAQRAAVASAFEESDVDVIVIGPSPRTDSAATDATAIGDNAEYTRTCAHRHRESGRTMCNVDCPTGTRRDTFSHSPQDSGEFGSRLLRGNGIASHSGAIDRAGDCIQRRQNDLCGYRPSARSEFNTRRRSSEPPR